ncbi:MAG: 4-hydroxy-tetrahydrodipicolinate reductase [Cyclobacteriaceae bacterium]|nr:4-hydroxy-tetrahydrodipicolinate reductase [Cyclobacteriaceae bacterium]
MKIALIGYGKMGKAIAAFALKRNHTIVTTIDSDNPADLLKIKGADVAIEFSQPSAVVNNLKACFDAHVPVVCGTTGWLENRNEVEAYCRTHNGTFLYASNFSLGVNIFFELNERLATMMDKYPAYDVEIDEIHHTQKKDAPSGTAITLAESILHKMERKKNWVNKDPSNETELAIHSYRKDPTPGTHTVKYSSPIDTIEIKYTAHSRDGFALGALLVAEWIQDKKGVLQMGDFLKR